MSESTFPRESSGEPAWENTPPGEDVPRFGAVDIVEAFTAMRHEWRGQTKECRALAEQIQAAAAMLESLASKPAAAAAETRTDDSPEAKALAMILVETDHQFSRAAAAIALWEANRKIREAAD